MCMYDYFWVEFGDTGTVLSCQFCYMLINAIFVSCLSYFYALRLERQTQSDFSFPSETAVALTGQQAEHITLACLSSRVQSRTAILAIS